MLGRSRHRGEARRLGLAAAAAALLTLPLTSAAGAYTQLISQYPNTPTTCTNSGGWDCIAWPRLANGQSTTVYAFLDGDLGDVPNVNMGHDVLDSFTRWNAAPSNEPWLIQSTALSNATGYSLGSPTHIFADDQLPYGVYAKTASWTMYLLGLGSDDHVMVSSQIDMSANIRWNHSLDFTCHYSTPDPTVCIPWADSRKVTIHEEGHGLGLGHSGATAIMRQGATTYYTLQTDDINGIQSIYGTP